MELKELVESYSFNNGNLDALKGALKMKEDTFKEENKGLMKSIEEAKEFISNEKKIIEEKILEEFKKDKTVKKFYGGLGVQERKAITYDSKVALDWAKEKDMFLLLDKKSFEKVAESLNLDFVTSDTNDIVTFPKKIKL